MDSDATWLKGIQCTATRQCSLQKCIIIHVYTCVILSCKLLGQVLLVYVDVCAYEMFCVSVVCTLYMPTHPYATPPTAHVPDRDPGEDVDGDEPDWPLFEEVCELRSGVRFSCQVSR